MKYSGKRIMKAGDALRNFNRISPDEFRETVDVISYWRQLHEEPVKNALASIKSVVDKLDRDALFARRMKRIPSIYSKLDRYPRMSLYKMNDIGGCRVIVKDRQVLNSVLRGLRALPEFKIQADGSNKINDYIQNPKEDGYRSVHIIGKFDDENGEKRFVEVQLRTPIQHSWATAVEIVDLFTKQSLKTNQGSPEWASLFYMLGRHFTVMDRIKGFVDFQPKAQYAFYQKELKRMYKAENMRDKESEVYQEFRKTYRCLTKLNVIELFDGFANSLNIIDREFEIANYDGYVLITCNVEKATTSAKIFADANTAEKAYIDEEVKYSSDESVVVAMVSTPNLTELREAYPNYFADSSVFLSSVSRIEENFEDMQQAYFLTLGAPTTRK